MNIKRNSIIYVFYCILGLTLIVLGKSDFVNSIYLGFGGGIFFVGVFGLYRTIKYTRNKEYKEQVDVVRNDERYKYLSMKAWSITGYITVIGLGIAIIVSMLMNIELLIQTLCIVMCAITLVYYIAYLILEKKN